MIFSEKDLLILSNYVYFGCSANGSDSSIGATIDRLKDDNGNFDTYKLYAEGGISCNISEEEALDLFNQIDNDERLRNLHVVRALNDYDMRAVCFADEDESSACVVFRGTGGTYDAWYDNVTGEYEKDTKLQKVAADFVKNDCGAFNNLTVSGHSKGGNLAQYVTVTCASQITSCVSFDGQGFGRKFLYEYREEIKEAADKITSISAYNDYVNILLTPIASKRIFLKNYGKNIDGHSSGSLLCSISFSEDGSIDRNESQILQGLEAWIIEQALDKAVDIIDILPFGGEKKASNIIAAALASIMSNDKGEEYEKSEFKEAVKSFGSYTANMISLVETASNPVDIMYRNCGANCAMIRRTYEIIYDTASYISEMIERVMEVKEKMNYIIAGRYYTDIAIDRVVEKLINNRKRVLSHTEILKQVFYLYTNDETDILNHIESNKV